MQTTARVMYGWSDEARSRQLVAYFRECVTEETGREFYQVARHFDVSGLLPEVRQPTLVVHIQHTPTALVDAARNLVTGLPDARLAVLPDRNAMASAVVEFLGLAATPAEEGSVTGGFATILFTDMESSTALTQQLGDAAAQELVRAHNTLVRESLTANDGSEIKHTGDGIMASFSTASSALECAIAIQRAVVDKDNESLHLRIGLNAGEPVAEEDDLFGTAVQLAKRICDHAEPGQILVPDAVRHLAGGKGFLFSDLGEWWCPKASRTPSSSGSLGGRSRADGASHPVREDRRWREYRPTTRWVTAHRCCWCLEVYWSHLQTRMIPEYHRSGRGLGPQSSHHPLRCEGSWPFRPEHVRFLA